MSKVSCIIAAYNEAPRIGKVLSAVLDCNLVDEVIVVDDGSIDNTAEIIQSFPQAKLVRHEKNKGKNQAILTGAAAAQHDLIFLLDADLINVTKENITKIIEPILSDQVDIIISLRNNAPWIDHQMGIDFISGERVLPKRLILENSVAIAKLQSYGLEVFLNRLIIKNNYRIKVVRWDNVHSPWKHEKRGVLSGISGELLMYGDMLRTISVFEIVYQIVKMSKLTIK